MVSGGPNLASTESLRQGPAKVHADTVKTHAPHSAAPDAFYTIAEQDVPGNDFLRRTFIIFYMHASAPAEKIP
jgi:hypothetical protein